MSFSTKGNKSFWQHHFFIHEIFCKNIFVYSAKLYLYSVFPNNNSIATFQFLKYKSHLDFPLQERLFSYSTNAERKKIKNKQVVINVFIPHLYFYSKSYFYNFSVAALVESPFEEIDVYNLTYNTFKILLCNLCPICYVHKCLMYLYSQENIHEDLWV